jgi:TATA-box binding protein (TBP) (component of TFIID and TFIIIB)
MVPNIGLYSLVETRLLLLRNGATAAFRRPNISNIVMSGNSEFFIDLANFVADNEHRCNYVPETFSGCSFSPFGLNLDLLGEKNDAEVPAEKRKKKKKAVLFEDGAINFMGLRSYDEGFDLSRKTIAAIKPYQSEFRKNKSNLVATRVRELNDAREERKNQAKRQRLSTDSIPSIVY